MDLDSYDRWAAVEMDWMRSRLLREGVEALLATCEELGEQGMRELMTRHESGIRDYIGAARNRRESILRQLPSQTERHAFLIGAAYTVRCGALLLALATRYGLSASYRPSKSFLLLQAAATADELHRDFPSLWPFDEHDPFHEGLCDRND